MSKQSEYAIIAERLQRGETCSVDLNNESFVSLLDAYNHTGEYDGLIDALNNLVSDLGLEAETVVKLLDASTVDRLEHDAGMHNLLKVKLKTRGVSCRFQKK